MIDSKETINFKHAVIDVGSNSVRLVIYQITGQSFVPIHNEKVLAGLGRGIDETGNLSPIGVELALNAIRRFKLLIDALDIKSYDAIATAAARDANNGGEFIRIINEEIGLKLRLISGEEEGRLSAIGVKYGAPKAKGIMGDLGGSSLELVSLDNIEKRESWHLGPLAIGERAQSRNFTRNISNIEKSIHNELDVSQVLKLPNIEEFHAVGGGWRNLAQIAMWRNNYNLHVLQNFSMNQVQAIELCEWVMQQPKRVIEKIPGISQRRADTLQYAALLLLKIINATNCKEILISSYGLREGILSERFLQTNNRDPLIESAWGICKSRPEDVDFAYALNDWIRPLLVAKNFKINHERVEILCLAACLLANIGIGLHPDHRAFLTYQLVLRAPYPAVTHNERVFLARTIARRYGAKNDEINGFECANLISIEYAALADVIGASMRLGANLTSNSSKIIKQTKLNIQNDDIELILPEDMKNLVSESVRKRLDQLVTTYRKAVV